MSLITRSRTVHAIAPEAKYFYGVNEKNQTVAVPGSDIQSTADLASTASTEFGDAMVGVKSAVNAASVQRRHKR